MEILGIDIGGTGIKGAPVNAETGELLAERVRILTPDPSTPEAVAECVAEISSQFNWKGLIGCGYPGVVKHGVTMTAANVDQGWIGADAQSLINQATGCPVAMLNDADAAGIAEIKFGAGKDVKGVVTMLTIGTGIGVAMFTDGVLVPNLEFGHLLVRGKEAEKRASERVRIKKQLSWKRWSGLLNEYLTYFEALTWPDLFIVGGGVSKKFDTFAPYLTIRTPIVPAQMMNEAGIVGAAMYALDRLGKNQSDHNFND